MRISVIVAMDRNGLIGHEGGLPWHLPSDLRRFRQLTIGKPVIMGRTTHEHIGKPLPGRENIVLSRTSGSYIAGCTVARSLDEAIRAVGEAEEVFVIGGATVYREVLPAAGRIYLTLVDGVFAGTTYFPTEMVHPGEWVVTRRELCDPDAKNPYRHLFLVLDRAEPGSASGQAIDLAATLAAPLDTARFYAR
jgi:dihydrofolate reductase